MVNKGKTMALGYLPTLKSKAESRKTGKRVVKPTKEYFAEHLFSGEREKDMLTAE